MSEEATGASLQVRKSDISSAEARKLIAELDAELSVQYPEQGATHFRLEPDEVTEGRGAFFVATSDGEPVGCGAIRRISPGTGEIKRIYVHPESRGFGVGRALLVALESEARKLGFSRLVLETGVRQLEAIALYKSAGFTSASPFGEYIGSPLSACMGKEL